MLLLTLLFVIVFSATSFSQRTMDVEGTTFGTWDADTVNVIGNIFIPEKEILTIAPGCVVNFTGFYSITNRGTILAIGNSENIIKFTVSDTTGFHDFILPEGGWNRIEMFDQMGDADTTLFEFCRFEYSKTDTLQRNGGAIYAENFPRLRIENCTFSNNRAYVNGGAVYLKTTEAIIINNTFEYNHGGTSVYWGYGGAVCGISSIVQLCGNIFRSNTSTGIGGGCSFEFIMPTLDGNVFHNNYSALGGAFSYLRAFVGGITTNNLVYNNSSEFFGGAIALITSSPYLINNTVVENYSIYGGGLYCNESSNPKVYNSIFWGNFSYAGYGNQVFIWDANSQPEFYNSLFQQGPSDFAAGGYGGVYENCIEVDPMFENGGNQYELSRVSPCIEGGVNEIDELELPGIDLAGNPRIHGAKVDLGAFEFQGFFTLTIAIIPDENSGSVTGEGQYAPGDSVCVFAFPNEDFIFSYWTLEDGTILSDSSTYCFQMPSQDFIVVANFALKPLYSLNLLANPSQGGSVSEGGTYYEGTELILTASPNNGYYFLQWTNEENEMVSDQLSFTYFMPGNDVTLIANFNLMPLYSLQIDINPEDGGAVEGAGEYTEGTLVELIASSNEGFNFVAWTDSNGSVISHDSTFGFTMPANDVSLTANFEVIAYTVTFFVSSSTTAVVGANVYFNGQDIETDAEGRAVFSDLQSGTYDYIVSKEGYHSINGVVEVSQDIEEYISLTPLSSQVEIGAAIKIFPNPFNQNLYFENVKEICQISIVNALGQIVAIVFNNGEERVQVNTSSFLNGMFQVICISQNGEKQFFKLVKH